jgi:1-deoxy-D-xylulose-5-phosphate reductoisomerase
MKKIIILGSTGSIGQQTLEIVRKFPQKFQIIGLAGGKNYKLLQKQIQEFKPTFASIDEQYTQILQKTHKIKILSLEELAIQKCDLIVSAIAGVAGLTPTLSAIQTGRHIALANKESLVLAGEIMLKAAKKSGAKIFPIDSEHSALWQLLQQIHFSTGNKKKLSAISDFDLSQVHKVFLTASGGALRDYPLQKLKHVSPQEVLRHPTWKMGAKITLDCATMANKAFEIIEAHHLFGLPYEKIEAVIHPQSLVHAMVETVDGNIFAQISNPDMRLPIQLALFAGERKKSLIQPLNLIGKNLEFRKIERKRYPLFYTILEAAQSGGLAPTVAAIASESAGEKFLADEITFLDIVKLTRQSLKKIPRGSANLENILAIIK